MVADMTTAEQRLLSTRDGGTHWRRLPLRDLFVRAIQYIGSGRGFAYSFDPYKQQAYLYTTAKSGRSWRKTELPAGFWVDQMAFANGQTGLLGGCLHRRIVILRTTDGGVHWSVKSLKTPASQPIVNSGCDVSVDHLTLSANGQASLLAQKRAFPNGDSTGFVSAWISSNAGLTWKRVFQTVFQTSPNAFTNFDGPYVLGGRLTLIFKNGPDNRSAALYTRTGDDTWTEAPLDAPMSGCFATPESLTCSGGIGAAFRLARITVGGTR
jgi:hypothetical protein